MPDVSEFTQKMTNLLLNLITTKILFTVYKLLFIDNCSVIVEILLPFLKHETEKKESLD